MSTTLTKGKYTDGSLAVLIRSEEDAKHPLLEKIKNTIGKKLQDKENGFVTIYDENKLITAVILKQKNNLSAADILEEARQKGGQLTRKINREKYPSVTVIRSAESVTKEEVIAFTEGMSLNNYQFLKYKTEKKEHSLKNIVIDDEAVSQGDLDALKNVIDASELARNLANEPVVSLNSVQLGEIAEDLGKKLHFKTNILQKKEIEKLKMGGLLGVNMGSSVPPTFSILEYHPENAVNKKPLILIGKGVTYDTGGYSLKPPQSMMTMKMDMSGAAAVLGTFNAIVSNHLNIYCIGLIPSTDNKISSDALTPDDVITMHDGTTVEVLNTDAEGRLILGDALSYAKQFDPELVIDLATLTGAAAIITGTLGSALMGTDTKYKNDLIEAGEMTYERLWEIPYWKEYAEMLKSDIADLKNIGGPVGGSATAGKFLEHFTSYPWLHLDIAGPAILKDDEPYRQRGASGVGVRLLYAFAKKFVERMG